MFRTGFPRHPCDSSHPCSVDACRFCPHFRECKSRRHLRRWSAASSANACARAKGGRSRIMTREKPHYAWSLMIDRTHPIPEIGRELGDLPASTLYLHPPADDALEDQTGGFSMHEPRIRARADQARSPAGIRYGRSLRCQNKSIAE